MNFGRFVVLPSPTPLLPPASQSIEKPRCPNYGKQMVEIPKFRRERAENHGQFLGRLPMWSGPLSGHGPPRKGWNLPLPHVPKGLRLLGRGTGFRSGRTLCPGPGANPVCSGHQPLWRGASAPTAAHPSTCARTVTIILSLPSAPSMILPALAPSPSRWALKAAYRGLTTCTSCRSKARQKHAPRKTLPS